MNTFVTESGPLHHLHRAGYVVAPEMVEAHHAEAYRENLRLDGRCEVCEEPIHLDVPHANGCPLDEDEIDAAAGRVSALRTSADLRLTWVYEIQEPDRCGRDYCPHMDPITTTTATADDGGEWTARRVAESVGREWLRRLGGFRVCVWAGSMVPYREPEASITDVQLRDARGAELAQR